MKYSLLVTLNLAALLVAGCSSAPAKVDTGPIHAATYNFIDKTPSMTPEYADRREQVHALIQDSISRNLASKGLGKVVSGGDVIVAYLVIIGNNATTEFSAGEKIPLAQVKASTTFPSLVPMIANFTSLDESNERLIEYGEPASVLDPETSGLV